MPPKFDGVDFSGRAVERLEVDNPPEDEGFRCARREFVTYWRRGRIQREVRSSVCQAWFLRDDASFAGYVSLLADKLEVGEGEQVLIEEGIQYRSFPAVKIGLLAADERAKGAGTQLLEWALVYIAAELSPKLGIRFVTVDALYDPDTEYDTAGYYRRFGFRLANTRDPEPREEPFRTMFLDIMPFVLAIQASAI